MVEVGFYCCCCLAITNHFQIYVLPVGSSSYFLSFRFLYHDHDRRQLAEENGDHHDEEEEEGVTLCYCNAKTENEDKSTVVCSDADLAHKPHDSHDSHDESSATRIKVMLGAAISMMMGFVL